MLPIPTFRTARLLLAKLAGLWGLHGYGTRIIEEIGGGSLIGRAGPLHPDGWADPEVKWIIAPSARGRGYAKDAARAVLNFAFDELGFESIVSMVRPENTVSAHMAEELGGFLDRTIDFMNGHIRVFRYARVA